MKNKALFIVTLFFLLGCKQEQSSTDILTLSVDLEQSSLRYDDVFSNAEIIPLETTDSSLIAHIFDVNEYKDNFYIYDIRSVKAFAFDHKGKFICQLGKKGQGPGEYSWLASIAIDRENDIIHLVEPLGRFHNYSPDGKYINSPKYPDGNDYQHL
ncbi:MAG: 6-bladed beta-propeller, partial [Bacteroidaceae bacterium]|nr:6-bladed beta-propeller [Bacteroidaceae bacterium]